MKPSQTVRRLAVNEVAEVVDVLTESFFDYPVTRFVLGNESDYGGRIKTLIHFFVMARFYKKEVALGLGDPGGLSGVALLSFPHRPSEAAELDSLREKVWRQLGDAARKRYEAFGEAFTPFLIEPPHLHLNMIGVRRSAQGQGVGRRLIDHVHMMSRQDPESVGVTLSTEDEANVALYQHLGYRIEGQAVVAPGLKTWVFFRPDQPIE